MMKIPKPHKIHKRTSPVHMPMKKSMHSGSMRGHGSSRHPGMKHPPPGMKPMLHKRSHSPGMHSPHSSVSHHSMHGSPDRNRSFKRSKYDKPKHSPSPDMHRLPPHRAQSRSPFHDEPYSGSRPPPRSHISPPPAKKPLRKEPHGYDRDITPPPMHRPDIPMNMGGRMAHRESVPLHSPPRTAHPRGGVKMKPFRSPGPDEHFEAQGRGRGGPLPGLHSKRPPKGYDSPPDDRYRGGSPPPGPYHHRRRGGSDDAVEAEEEEKRYVPTLHERFSTVVESSRTEPRVKYSREDLEKITIDIHRNIKEPSPTRRHIVDPSDVKLVRRANEGHRPMFDRDEIKQSARDLREDAYYEKKAPPHYPPRDESYEITRSRFDPQAARSLNDRWQAPDAGGRKDGAPLDQDDRDMQYNRPIKRITPDDRSKSRDRDFRSERYPVDAPRGRMEFSSRNHSPPPDSRGPPMHHKDSMDIRRKVGGPKMDKGEPMRRSRSRSRGRYPSPPDKHYRGSFPRGGKHHGDRRSPGPDPYKWPPRRTSFGRDDDFPRRPDKYYKPQGHSRGSSYYEGPDRRSPEPYRGRGGSRPFRRGMRGRGGFRGSPRGGFSPRGSNYRGRFRGSDGMRGRGAPRRGRMSPGFWEHDLYSPDDHRKMDLP